MKINGTNLNNFSENYLVRTDKELYKKINNNKRSTKCQHRHTTYVYLYVYIFDEIELLGKSSRKRVMAYWNVFLVVK